MKSYQALFRGVFAANFKEQMIPAGISLNEYVNTFQETLKECTLVLQLLKNGMKIKDNEVQNLLKSDNISAISQIFYSEYSFQRLCEDYLISMSNTIIATCSTIASFSSLTTKDFSQMKAIAEASSSAIELYISLNNVALPNTVELLKFKVFDIDKDFSKYLNLEREERKLRLKEKELEEIKFKSHVCYLCDERPAISAILPCGHTFLCLECLEEAIKSNNVWKCFVCGNKIESVMRIRTSNI